MAVPFTTPSLLGTRLRHAARGLELVVPHPARARGVYVMTCADLPQYGAATLHDLRLAERLTALRDITPRSVRRVGLDVAAQGLAGRPARAAALAAEQTDRGDRTAAIALLLQRLIHQTSGAPSNQATFDVQAKQVLLRLAGQLGRPAAVLTTDIEAIAGLAAGVILAQGDRPRCAGWLADVGALAADLRAQAANLPGKWGQAARLVIASAAATHVAVSQRLAELAGRLEDVRGCLAEWGSAPARLTAAFMMPEWMLDGWPHTWLIWRESSLAAPHGALAEMALQVPILPREAAGTAVMEARPLVTGAEDWRSGATVFDLVARNERILAHAS